MRIDILPKAKKLVDNRDKVLALIGLLVLALSLWIAASAQSQDLQTEDPMESRYSQAIRAEYAKCRGMQDATTQFFCTCKLMEEQCESPRGLGHGDWNTVEFWPSNDPAEREVQFVLFSEFDFMGDFAPINKGLIMTCMAGISEINIFVGDNVDPHLDPVFYLGDELAKASYDTENKMFTFDDPSSIYAALIRGEDVSITYNDLEDEERVLDFETYGFDNASKGWEKLCREKAS